MASKMDVDLTPYHLTVYPGAAFVVMGSAVATAATAAVVALGAGQGLPAALAAAHAAYLVAAFVAAGTVDVARTASEKQLSA